MKPLLMVVMIGAGPLLGSGAAFAWGDTGHEIVGLIAEHYLKPAVRQKVLAMLATDTTKLTRDRSIAVEATWADKYRDSDRDGARVRYLATRRWHFVDIELDDPNLQAACLDHQCIVDKIVEFRADLSNPHTSFDERRTALQFLLHLIGDIHQPLHASDDHDQGGNARQIKACGLRAGRLHQYWDTDFVRALGLDANTVAAQLIRDMTLFHRILWARGGAADWALESFQESKRYVYDTRRPQYCASANSVVRRQLSRAGLRLAKTLNEAIGS